MKVGPSRLAAAAVTSGGFAGFPGAVLASATTAGLVSLVVVSPGDSGTYSGSGANFGNYMWYTWYIVCIGREVRPEDQTMTFSLQITDQNGRSVTRELAAKTIGRTELKLAC
jgi:hypothetical protein